MAAVLHYLEKNYPENFYRTCRKRSKEAVPGIKRIFTPHLGDPGQVGIGVEEEQKTGYFVGPQLSDGFLVFPGPCCTLFNLPDQPRIFLCRRTGDIPESQ